MNHGKKLKKLSRSESHRKALIRNLVKSLVEHEQVKTTVAKAKVLRPVVEKLITKAKNGSLHTQRILMSRINCNKTVSKLINDIAVRSKDRKGGYTRILKNGFRYGDCAPMAVIELVDSNFNTEEEGEATTEVNKG